MSKKVILKNPTKVSDLSFDDLYEEFDDWELKANKLIARRERQFRDTDSW